MPFELPKLNYAFDALEPNIDSKTMEIFTEPKLTPHLLKQEFPEIVCIGDTNDI